MTRRTPLVLFNELAESLKQAEGAVSQLIHLSGHPVEFMMMRDALGLVLEGVKNIAPHNVLMAPKTVIMGKK